MPACIGANSELRSDSLAVALDDVDSILLTKSPDGPTESLNMRTAVRVRSVKSRENEDSGSVDVYEILNGSNAVFE